MKKYKIIILCITLIVSSSVVGQKLDTGVDTVNIYYGGRSMYSSMNLVLFSDSTYQYYSWLRKSEAKDSGEWEIVDSNIVLNSKESETISKVRPTKKERKKSGISIRLVKDTMPIHVNDTFRIDNHKILLYKQEDILEEGDESFYKVYLTLYEKRYYDSLLINQNR